MSSPTLKKRLIRPLSVGLASIVLLSGLTAIAAPQAATAAENFEPNPATTMWYDKPAKTWQSETLPIGNGAQAATIYGGLATEQITLNEESVWSGGPGSKQGYDFGNWPTPRPGALKEVQDKIDAEGQMDPDLVSKKLGNPAYSSPLGDVPGFGRSEVFGGIFLDVPDAAATTNYKRSLDLGSAVASVDYTTATGAKISRDYFASYPANAIMVKLAADQDGKINFTTRFGSPRTSVVTAADGRITVKGTVPDNGLKLELQAQVKADGGTVTSARRESHRGRRQLGHRLHFHGHRLRAPTTPRTGAPTRTRKSPKSVDNAVAKGKGELLAEHLADYKGLYDNMSLNSRASCRDIPTDQSSALPRQGKPPPSAPWKTCTSTTAATC